MMCCSLVWMLTARTAAAVPCLNAHPPHLLRRPQLSPAPLLAAPAPPPRQVRDSAKGPDPVAYVVSGAGSDTRPGEFAEVRVV